MKKGALLTIGFLAFVAYVSYSLMSMEDLECDVCILYNDKEVCQKVTGMDKQETIMMGVSTACGGAANGRAENIECNNKPPIKATCKEL
ncbi:MAG: hypothetical protein ACE5GQ_03605 [Nitrospinales bacterium]